MREIIILAKIKFDLRDPDEIHFAQHEIEAILGTNVKPIKTIPALFRDYPFNRLTEEIIQVISRHLYLGKIQGYLAASKSVNTNKLLLQPSFFKEIYLIIETSKEEKEIKQSLSLINEDLYQMFEIDLESGKRMFVIRLLPLQTLFEYVTDVKKLPAVAITPRNRKDWNGYFAEKEEGIEEGLNELLKHLKSNYYRAPHLGLGKQHIGDFVDWASTDLRKPFLHYLHKYKGKGDPRIPRALINLL